MSSNDSTRDDWHAQLLSRADARFAGREGAPLPGADLPWTGWVRAKFPHSVQAPFAARHRALWEWIDALAPGQAARPFVGIWGRGGGKSSTVEMGVARVCAKLSRRFVLYVCGTQADADKHTQTVATRLEALGVGRSVNQYGASRGWKRDQLRTNNGFNVAGIGLDVAVRGVKLDDFRPDLIIFDDVDALEDSIQTTGKKAEIITQSILPAGSVDCAIIFIQNMIHANSLAAQLAYGRADFLRDRLPVEVHPAIVGLQYTTVEQPQGPPLVKITGGTPTWAGQTWETCERQINTWGLRAFLREAQHQVNVSGALFFPEFAGPDHHGPGRNGRHVCAPFEIEPHCTWIGALDWGYRAPFCFLLGAIDERGDVAVTDEIYKPGLTNGQQAENVCRLLHRRRIAKQSIIIACDPSMWARKHLGDGTHRADIEDFQAAGLICVRANNSRQAGWNNVRSYLDAPGGLTLFLGRCPNVIRTLGTAVFSRTHPEDLDDDADIPPGHMDAVNALRYLLAQRLRASTRPPPPGPPDWQIVDDGQGNLSVEDILPPTRLPWQLHVEKQDEPLL